MDGNRRFGREKYADALQVREISFKINFFRLTY
jgi:hypothetical protein